MEKATISPQQLQSWLEQKDPVYMLDVRPKEQREEWYIPESVHLDAYQRLHDGDETVLDELDVPADIPVVTVCAAGKTSLKAAELLRRKGITAYSLEGGMKAWNYAWNMAHLHLDETLSIIQMRRVAKGCLSYLAGSQNEAIVVDASLDPEVYIQIAKQQGWHIRYVMDTHIHADYLSRTRELAAVTGAAHLFIDTADVDFPFAAVSHNEEISFGKAKVKVLHTPGHTWESTSYLINDKALLTGDTLFTDGVGRPDLKADKDEAVKKATQLYSSLHQLLALPSDTIVLPAHISHPVTFDDTMIQATLSALKKELTLLQLSKEEFIEASLSRIPPTPPNYQTIAMLNKQGYYEGYNPEELEAGANRCAVA